MPYMSREQSANSEHAVAPDAWINRLLQALEDLPPAAPAGETDPLAAIAVCSPECVQRERELAAARLAEWTA